MAFDRRLDEVSWQSLSKATTLDMAVVEKLRSDALCEIVGELLCVPTHQGGVLRGLNVVPTAFPLVVRVSTGLGMVYDVTGGWVANNRSLSRPVFLDQVVDLTLSAPDPVNDRIDLIEISGALYSAENETIQVWNLVTSQYDPVVVPRRKRMVARSGTEVKVKEGTPAFPPVCPSVDPGFLALAEVLVPTVGAITITDRRVSLLPRTLPRLHCYVAGSLGAGFNGAPLATRVPYQRCDGGVVVTDAQRDVLGGIFVLTLSGFDPSDTLLVTAGIADAGLTGFSSVCYSTSSTDAVVVLRDSAAAFADVDCTLKVESSNLRGALS